MSMIMGECESSKWVSPDTKNGIPSIKLYRHVNVLSVINAEILLYVGFTLTVSK